MDHTQPAKDMDYAQAYKLGNPSLAAELLQTGLEAWEYAPTDEDQKLQHKYFPNRPVPSEHIHGLGVLHWKLDIEEWEKNPQLEEIKKNRGYIYSDVFTVSPQAMDDFEKKVKVFFKEHLHSQEESRLILAGSGYWDIRDYDEKWLRFRVTKGDLIVLPPGMFHRFTLDEDNYIKAVLLYTEVPCRTQEERTGDECLARKLYVENFLSNRIAVQSIAHIVD